MRKIIAALIGILMVMTGSADTNPVNIASVPNGSNAVLTVSNFLTIKNFILTNGLNRTYCQMYNNNPYFGFKGMNAYLNPDTHQANVNCDRTKSDFNTLVLHHREPTEYWHVTWDQEKNKLLIQKPGSRISPQVLNKTVEDLFRQQLEEIEQKKQSHK